MGKLSNAKKLTKTEQYAIEGMVSNGMDVSEIAKSLSRDVDLVSEYVSSIEEPEKKEHKSNNKVLIIFLAVFYLVFNVLCVPQTFLPLLILIFFIVIKIFNWNYT